MKEFDNLVDLIIDGTSMNMRMELMRVSRVLHGRPFMDTLMHVVRMLLEVITLVMATHSEVYDLNCMSIDKDVHILDEATQLE